MLWLWPPFAGEKVRYGVWAWSSESLVIRAALALEPGVFAPACVAVLGPAYGQTEAEHEVPGPSTGRVLGGEQSESEMSLCLQTVLLDERRSCLHIKKGSFVFRWRVFISVLEVYPGEATYHWLSSTASPVGKGG